MSQESCRMPCLAAMQLTDLSCHVRPQGEREGRDLPLHSHSSGEDYASIRKPRFLHTLWLWSCRASCSGQEVLFYSEGSWKIQQGHFQKVWHLQRNLRSAKIKISSYNRPRLNVQMNLVWTNFIRNQLKFSWDKSFVIWKKELLHYTCSPFRKPWVICIKSEDVFLSVRVLVSIPIPLYVLMLVTSDKQGEIPHLSGCWKLKVPSAELILENILMQIGEPYLFAVLQINRELHEAALVRKFLSHHKICAFVKFWSFLHTQVMCEYVN